MKKNDLATVVCERLGSNGEGVASFEGVTLFVPGLLVGERALVKILSVKNGIAYGKVEELYTPALSVAASALPLSARVQNRAREKYAEKDRGDHGGSSSLREER